MVYNNGSTARKEMKLEYPTEVKAIETKSKSVFREYLEAVIIALVLAMVLKAFVVQAFKIPSGSMKSTLLIGDQILVTKFAYGIKIPFMSKDIVSFEGPKRKDVVVFKYPVEPDKDFIKRVIGLPGDTVRVVNKKVYVNDQELDEPYTQHTDHAILPGNVSPRDNFGPVTVPAGNYFMMGDNRDESYDSRFWKFVDRSALKGKAFIIYWSWNGDGQWRTDPGKSYFRWDRIGRLLH